MGLEGDDGELLAGDPIPGATGGATFGDTDHSAVVGDDDNLWDHLIFEQEVIEIQAPTEPGVETSEPGVETSEYETTPKDIDVIEIGPYIEPAAVETNEPEVESEEQSVISNPTPTPTTTTTTSTESSIATEFVKVVKVTIIEEG